MPLSSSHSPNLLKRSLLYTAITRAKEKVYLIGDSSVLEIFVHNNKQHDGYCGLSDEFALNCSKSSMLKLWLSRSNL